MTEMYEDLTKALRCKGLHYEDCEKQGCKYIKNGWCDYYRLNIEAADAIEELQRQLDGWVEPERKALIKSLPRWIPVTERLPMPRKPVLVTYLGYNSHLPCADMLAYIDSDDGVWYWWDDTEPSEAKCIVTITHWMPLPEPPKDGAGE